MSFTPIRSSPRTCSEFPDRAGRMEPVLLRAAIAYAGGAISNSLRRSGDRHSHFAAPRLAGLVWAALLGHPLHHAKNGTGNAPELVCGDSANERGNRNALLDISRVGDPAHHRAAHARQYNRRLSLPGLD